MTIIDLEQYRAANEQIDFRVRRPLQREEDKVAQGSGQVIYLLSAEINANSFSPTGDEPENFPTDPHD